MDTVPGQPVIAREANGYDGDEKSFPTPAGFQP
jgi:hypothetical protein